MSRNYYGANAGTDHNVKERTFDECWGALESLPPLVRRILWTCPFNQDETEIAEIVAQGRAQGASEQRIAQVIAGMLRQDVALHRGEWGPGYPNIPFTPLEPKPRRSARRATRFL